MKPDHLLRIVHRTHYHYAEPVTFQSHRLVVRPREGHDLRVEALDLTISPAAEVTWTRDIHGNSIAQVEFRERGDSLKIDVDVVVRRFFDPTSPPNPNQSPNPYPLEYDALEQGILVAYLTPGYPEEMTAVRDWIQTLPQPEAFASADDFVLRLTEIINDQIGDQRRDQKGVQSPATTLSLRTGSCRDVATLMIEVLRHLGIAARFASGYLDCPASRAARGSTHAWTEAYFPQLGWRGFDSTLGRHCDHRHIVTGTSHHPRGVMPVTGRFFGASGAFQRMFVAVEFSSPVDAGVDPVHV